MKRFLLVCVIVLVWTSSALAQTYTIKSDDKALLLAARYYNDAVLWPKIVNMNEFLREPGRVFEKDGDIVLILKPGEELVGLEALKVDQPKAIPIGQLRLDMGVPNIVVSPSSVTYTPAKPGTSMRDTITVEATNIPNPLDVENSVTRDSSTEHKSWFDKNKKWFVPVAIGVAGSVGACIAMKCGSSKATAVAVVNIR